MVFCLQSKYLFVNELQGLRGPGLRLDNAGSDQWIEV